jgi:hypothetical protein
MSSFRDARGLLLLVGGSAIACAHGPRPVDAARAAPAAVYAALIDSVFTRPVPDTLLVAESTLVFRAPVGGVSAWRTQFDSLPTGLPRALESASAFRQSSEELPLPRPTRIVTRRELREIFARGIERGWEEFARRYPRQRNYLQFSRVVFTSGYADALVYYEYHCGGLCGGGEIVWLVPSDNGRWRVRKRIQRWVS